MELNIKKVDNVVVIYLTGRLDVHLSAEIEKEINNIIFEYRLEDISYGDNPDGDYITMRNKKSSKEVVFKLMWIYIKKEKLNKKEACIMAWKNYKAA